MRPTIFSLALLFLSSSVPRPDAGPVEMVRLPAGAVQPDVAIDEDGLVHLVYLAGDPAAADVYYAASTDWGASFSKPIRVNSQPGSAIAMGTIRGAQVAVGRDGRVHVAWNGSMDAEPKPPLNPKSGRAGSPMLYARSDPERATFAAQRNLITSSTNLDGGGSIATDRRGGVYVVWHGNDASGDGGEEGRRVWLARSIDDGATFSRESPISDAATGACGCCGMRIFAEPGGYLRVLYRAAAAGIHRDVYALLSRDRGRTFTGEKLHPWEVPTCPMSSMSFAAGPPAMQAWETDGQVYLSRVGTVKPIYSPPGRAHRKHPRLAVSRDGTVLLAWAEVAGWSKGGSIAWQAFTGQGQPTSVRGVHAGFPPWSFPAVVARPDGGFTIIY